MKKDLNYLKEELRRLRFLEKILTMALEEPDKAKLLLEGYKGDIRRVRNEIANVKFNEKKEGR